MPFTIIAETAPAAPRARSAARLAAISGDPKKAFFIEPVLCHRLRRCGVSAREAILDPSAT